MFGNRLETDAGNTENVGLSPMETEGNCFFLPKRTGSKISKIRHSTENPDQSNTCQIKDRGTDSEFQQLQ